MQIVAICVSRYENSSSSCGFTHIADYCYYRNEHCSSLFATKKEDNLSIVFFVPLEVLFSNELLTDLGRIWALRYIIADPKVVEYNYYIKRS